MEQLETRRLILRRFREEDLDPFAAICADPEVMRYASLDGKPLSRARAWNWMCSMEGHRELRGYGMWAVEEKSSGKLMGRIGLQYPEEFPDIEIAWLLGKAYWGKGYATEGATAALDHGFQALDKDSFISLIFPENTRSSRLAERLGEVYEGDFELHGKKLRLYRLHREKWRND